MLLQLTRLFWGFVLDFLLRACEAGLAHLLQLRHLVSLDLSACKVSDLTHLGQLQHLTALSLSGCKGVTDAGMAHVGQLQRLTKLDVSGCNKITDNGVPYLASRS